MTTERGEPRGLRVGGEAKEVVGGAQVASMKLSCCSSFESTFKLITFECALESTGELVKMQILNQHV